MVVALRCVKTVMLQEMTEGGHQDEIMMIEEVIEAGMMIEDAPVMSPHRVGQVKLGF